MYAEVLLVKDIDIGVVPSTPIVPTYGADVAPTAYASLIQYSKQYGSLISYAQEQRGVTIQHIVPNPKTETGQISTSSKTELELHTETAFHPYKPDYVLLLCLRGDPAALTTYAKVSDIVNKILFHDNDEDTIEALQLPIFETSIDESFRTDGQPDATFRTSVLRKLWDRAPWEATYDAHLMTGVTPRAQHALEVFRLAVNSCIEEVALEAGDLLVINNKHVVHGRKPFQARYDGTDRWLLRSMTMRTLPPRSHHDRATGVISTTFNN